MSLLFELPPVGEPIVVAPLAPGRSVAEIFPDHCVAAYASGTNALAAAIAAAISATGRRDAEIILPAYTCPNLVSAALWAHAKPVLVDFARQRPWMDLQSLENALSPHTAAVIAVNFLGIPERLGQLRQLAARAGALLIEDSAQAFPQNPEGDMTVLSFGRGKPISLLGGGVVLTRDPHLAALLPQGSQPAGQAAWRWQLKARLHNALIHPRLYAVARRIPFLHIGETRYFPLVRLEGADENLGPRLAANMEAYRTRTADIQRKLAAVVATLPADAIVDLPSVCAGRGDVRLLRYPLLISDPRMHAALARRLQDDGLGVSPMYRVPLPQISGLENLWDATNIHPNASEFASQLLTLPTHSRCDSRSLVRLSNAFRAHDSRNRH